MTNKGKAGLSSLRESVKMTIGSSFSTGYAPLGLISVLFLRYIVFIKGCSGFGGTVWSRSMETSYK